MDDASPLLSRWLAAAFTLMFASSVAAVLFASGAGGGVGFGPAFAAGLSVTVYGVLALAGFRGAPIGDRVSWWMAVVAAHAAFGLLAAWQFAFIRSLGLAAALGEAFGGFAPGLLVSLVAAPLAALPFRPRVPVWRVARDARGTWSRAEQPALDREPSPMPEAPVSAQPPVASASRLLAETPPAVHEFGLPRRALRITFERIADQLPPDMLVLPSARLGATLHEPGRVWVPIELVLPGLREGAVAVPATLLEAQLPRGALLISSSEARARWDALRLALPMDEIAAQMRTDGAHPGPPTVDLEATGTFPESAAPGGVPGTAGQSRERTPAAAAGVPGPTGHVSEEVSVKARPPYRRLRADEIEAVGTCLAPAGRFEIHTRDVDELGHLLSLGRDVGPDTIETVLRRLAAAVPSVPEAPTVLTLLTDRAALTVAAGEGAAIAVAVRRHGAPVALMELLVMRAARAVGLEPVRPPAAEGDGLPETSAPAALPLATLGGALESFGDVAPAVFRRVPPGLDVYVLRPGDSSPAPLARLAIAVDAALAGGELGRPESASLPGAGTRTEVRWVAMPAGRALLAVSGAVTRAGLARRQVAGAAAALEAS